MKESGVISAQWRRRGQRHLRSLALVSFAILLSLVVAPRAFTKQQSQQLKDDQRRARQRGRSGRRSL
jgi:hypothetical protein